MMFQKKRVLRCKIYIWSGMFSIGLANFRRLSDRMSDMLKKFSTSLLLSSYLPSVIYRSNLSPSRKAFHFYFNSNNDPTSPKGPRKQTTEPILGTAFLEKKTVTTG